MTVGGAASSESLFARANKVLPGGVNSPVRAFKSVGGTPPFIEKGSGSRIHDVDGNTYIDYVMSYGPLLFGHAPDFIAEAIKATADNGTIFGAPTRAEVEMAELVTAMVPSVEMIRFVNSGSEATTSAVRLARGATGRSKIVKCTGCFHGSVDSLLVAAGSGVATLGIPETSGVPASLAAETIVVEYNDPVALEEAFARFGDEIAAFIIEPIAANMGVVPPAAGYLDAVRAITTRHGALLIFDEVITGFRVAAGGAQEFLGVQPDLTCFGKIIGGGIPCGAYGGRRDFMEQLAPIGQVYQAGTLSGNPLAMHAGLAALKAIQSRGSALYSDLDQLGQYLEEGIKREAATANAEITVQRVGSILTPFFSLHPITNYQQARNCNTSQFNTIFHKLLSDGIYVAPSQFEAWFLSTAHTQSDLDETIATFGKALKNQSA
jgi:glutamate-1-semialdehyde 2,1-aminomutase